MVTLPEASKCLQVDDYVSKMEMVVAIPDLILQSGECRNQHQIGQCVANPTFGILGIPKEMEDDCIYVSTCKLHWTQLCCAAVGPELFPVHDSGLMY